MAAEPAVTPRAPWGRRLLLLLSAALLVALPTAWISSQYLGNEVNAALSFHAQDGWCEFGYTPDFGVHCFGDYVQTLTVSQSDFELLPPEQRLPLSALSPNASQDDYLSLYPPLAQLPHVISALWAQSFLGRTVAFYMYMAALALAVLTPALWVAWGWRRSAFALVPLLLLGVASVPVFSTLDRANSAGFVIPFLLAFGVFLGREPRWVAPAAAVAAGFIRPQLILIALGLLAVREWRRAVAAVAVFAVGTTASFALMPAGFTASARAWLNNISGLSSLNFSSVTSDSPANISLARSSTALTGWMSDAPGAVGAAGAWLQTAIIEQPLLPAAVLVITTAIVFIVGAGRIPLSVAISCPFVLGACASGVTPIYYLGFALVLGALIIGQRLPLEPGLLDDGRPSWMARIWGWLLIAAITLSLAPLVLVGDTPPGSPLMRNSIILENVGRLWLLIVVAGLAWATARLIRDRRRPADS